MNSLRFLSLALLPALTACGGAKENKAAAPVPEAEAPEPEPVVVVTALADTVYPSASAVRYTVEIPDTAVSGVIESLDDMYASAPGAFTFRNGPARRADFGGRVSGTPSEISVDWEFRTAVDTTTTKYGRWGGGTGWTGQPLYVAWPDSCLERFRAAGTLGEGFSGEEIIVGSLACRVYFIDFNTGRASREPIMTGNTIKGTASLDPTLNGNLYVGQGVPSVSPFGAMVVDLNSHAITHFTDRDPKALRGWGAYDSSPVRVGQFLFRPGENGTLYKYIVSPGSLTLHSALRYTVNGAAPGIESSMSVYRNYGFLADNHGNIIAVDLNTLTPVWHYALGDDTDATPMLDVEADGRPYIYVGREVDRHDSGEARFVKLDALTGAAVWECALPAHRVNTSETKHFDGGFYASALPGEGDCAGLVFSNCVNNTSGQNGTFVAFSRADGSVAYTVPLRHYAWSSPVGFMNENDEMFVVTGDTYGNLYLIRGIDGEVLFTLPVGSNFESSPVVVGNQLVVGSRGNSIFKLTVK